MIIGNFTNVGGQTRYQAAMIDLTSSPETLANWDTERFTPGMRLGFRHLHARRGLLP